MRIVRKKKGRVLLVIPVEGSRSCRVVEVTADTARLGLTAGLSCALEAIARARVIEHAHPQARSRYGEAAGIPSGALSRKDLEVVLAARKWRAASRAQGPAHSVRAVDAWIDGKTLRDIDRILCRRNGSAVDLIRLGVNRYCILNGWGSQV